MFYFFKNTTDFVTMTLIIYEFPTSSPSMGESRERVIKKKIIFTLPSREGSVIAVIK